MKKNLLFGAIRWLTLALAVVLLVVAASKNRISSSDFKTVCKATVKQAELSRMQQGSDSVVKRLYSLDCSEFDGVMLYWPVSNMDAEEILIVKLKDISQQETVKKAIENRLQTQKKSFDGYGVEQYDLLTTHAVVDIQGNYILFAVSPDCEKIESAFRAAL
jgi:hypothetical protein